MAGRLKISNDIGDLLKLIGNDGKNSADAAKLTIVNNILGKLAAEMAAKSQINNNVTGNNTEVSLNEATNTAKSMSSNSPAMPANNAVVTANGNNSAAGGTTVTSNVNAAADSIVNNSTNLKAVANNAVDNNVNLNTNAS